MKIIKIAAYVLLLVAAVSVQAQSLDESQNLSDSARNFVKVFYDWYLPRVHAPHRGFAAKDALKGKTSDFEHGLFQALSEDLEAQAKSHGYIVGIDFDPFLASQDPCEHYAEGKVAQVDDRYEVEITCVGRAKPDVIAEVKQQGTSWVFVDFIYPGDGNSPKTDLLDVLKLLKEERESSKSK